MTPCALLKLCKRALCERGIANFDQEAVWLVCDGLCTSSLQLYLHESRQLSKSALARVARSLRRRLTGEPLAYVIGSVEFDELTLSTDRRALIPRPETEELAQLAARHLRRGAGREPSVLDLASGSGCLALALKRRFPSARVAGSDISQKACCLAACNSRRCHLKIDWRVGSWWTPWQGQRFDCIVSNPPYLSREEWRQLDRQVRDFEPPAALIAGVTGLESYWQIAGSLGCFLAAKGIFLCEVGSDQAKWVQALFCRFGHVAQIRRDLQGKQRYIVVDRMGESQ